MTLDALRPLADRAALYAALRHEAFAAATAKLGAHRWDVDLDSGTVTFSSLADRFLGVTTQATLIATLAPGAGSLLWGWAHPQGDPEGPAVLLRQHGQESGIGALTEPQVGFPDESVLDPSWIEDTAQLVGLTAVDVIGRGPHFVAPLEGGTSAVFLLDAGLAHPTVAEAASLLPGILDSAQLHDGRTSAWGLARLADWALEWTDAGYLGARVRDASGQALFGFDEASRITSFQPLG